MRYFGVYFSELGMRFRSIGSAKGSWTLVLILLAIQGAVTLGGGHERLGWLFGNFGLTREGFFDGKVWQIFTYGLLHGGFLHVGLNALCIVLIGARVEHMLGRAVVYKTVATGVVAGGLAQLLLAPGGPNQPILVGASGGCMALLILLTTLSPDSKMWPVPVSARAAGIGVMAAELGLALVDPQPGIPGLHRIGEMLAAQGLAGWFSVSHACHFGGGMAGFVSGVWLLRPRITTARLRRDRERREARMAKSGGG